jgi:hypothetical protein
MRIKKGKKRRREKKEENKKKIKVNKKVRECVRE